MGRASTVNLDTIFTAAIERSKLLRAEAAKTSGDVDDLGWTQPELPLATVPQVLNAPTSGSRSSNLCKGVPAPVRVPTPARARPRRQCDFRNDALRINSLDLAISEARQDMADACAAVAEHPKSMSTTLSTSVVKEEDVIACSRLALQCEVLALPDDWGSTADRPAGCELSAKGVKEPLPSRYAPRRTPVTPLQSLISQVPSPDAGAAAEVVAPPISRWQRHSKHDKQEAAISAILRELEVLGKLLVERPILKRRAPQAEDMDDQSRRVRQCVLRRR